ncbi:MAG: dihydroorotate dehydrogenase [Gemmatimonadota bacterium]|nr:dihydroorotate dehydrogenase [Gemmatimonadota bacterium]MDH3366421.1 dihydroorotate dehydrogenase [Gemmatimonadota bacterium]MDH3478965.1 dihydroorotate dehydrogenase [Gemmatimonadota bacterium]MDH3570020.1 dihydroorotate dehydrogenase [Gemmatimonadota bacterium]
MTTATPLGALSVFGTTFQNPILLAAGTAGFGRELARVVDLDRLGGLITKAVSPEPRSGNAAPRVAEFWGGMLNAIGLANPGLDHVANVELPWLAAHLRQARVLVNVAGSAVEDYVTVIRRLASVAVVTGFELNVSCPNTEKGGEEFGANPTVLADLVRRCRSSTEKPLIVKLAPTLADVASTAAGAVDAGADGFSLVNTFPGTLYRISRSDRNQFEPRLGYGRGGVSGPALLPVGVLATRLVRERTGKPVIGMGGIRTFDDVEQYLLAGASLVAVGTAALADPRVPERLVLAWGRRG